MFIEKPGHTMRRDKFSWDDRFTSIGGRSFFIHTPITKGDCWTLVYPDHFGDGGFFFYPQMCRKHRTAEEAKKYHRKVVRYLKRGGDPGEECDLFADKPRRGA